MYIMTFLHVMALFLVHTQHSHTRKEKRPCKQQSNLKNYVTYLTPFLSFVTMGTVVWLIHVTALKTWNSKHDFKGTM